MDTYSINWPECTIASLSQIRIKASLAKTESNLKTI